MVLAHERGTLRRVFIRQQSLQLSSAGDLRPMPQKARRRGRDLECRLQRFDERASYRLCGAIGSSRIERQGFDDRLDKTRIVARHDAKGIAGLIGQARPLERQFDVAGFLARPPSGQHEIFGDRCRKGIALVKARLAWRGPGIGRQPDRGSRRSLSL